MRNEQQCKKLLRFEHLEDRQLLAANILLVSDSSAGQAPLADDDALANFLTASGHTIDSDSGAFQNSVPTVAELADVDLIVISRATNSGLYDGPLADDWNAIQQPIVVLNEFLTRSTRWGLFDTNTILQNQSAPLNYTFADPVHPFVADFSTEFASGNGFTIDVADLSPFSGVSLPSGATLVASAEFNQEVQPLIVDIPPGATTFGTSDILGGRRVFFSVPDYPDVADQDFGDVLSNNARSILSQILTELSTETVILQAEDAALIGGVTVQNVHAGSNGTYADYPSNGSGQIEWTTPVLIGGEYQLSFRYANNDSNGNPRPLTLSVNGQLVDSSLDFPVTNDWTNWTNTAELDVNLLPGINTISLAASTPPGGANIDELTLSLMARPPEAPSNLTATAVSSTQVNLTWDDNSTSETGFVVEREDVAGAGFAPVVTLPGNVTQFSDIQLSINTTYSYRVRAIRNTGQSDFSNDDSTTTLSTTSSPGILVITPEAGDTGVLRDVIISASLVTPNGGILPSSLNSSSVLLYPTANPTQLVATSLQTSGGGDTLIVNPENDLDATTSYTLVVTESVTDPSGAPFTPFTGTFTTGESTSVPDNAIQFERVELLGQQFTAVTIGPDGKLYAAKPTGDIVRFDLLTDGTLGPEEPLPGFRNFNGGNRLLIGIEFDPSATANNLILWATHSSFGFAGEPDFQGKLTRLSGPNLENVSDALINLPRSARDHLTNQIDFGPDGALYFLQGSNSANGAPDNAWSNRPERLLSAAVLRFDPSLYDFQSLGPLDVHTEDADPYDPFAQNAPLTLYATGIRNAYDLVWHSNGQLYVPTNANGGLGNTPDVPADIPPGGLVPRIDQATNGPFFPSQVDGIVGTGPTDDFLFRIEEGGYYGHPNPTRNEFIQDGGNPTAGVDPQEFTKYPIGTLPDRNYRGAAFNFGSRISPNGVIEYQHDGFDGALQGKLIVARYSTGDDLIVLDPSGLGGSIIDSNDAIESFDNLQDPLDLVEDPTNGFLYVAGFVQNSADGTLYLLRPIETSEPTAQDTYYVNQAVGAGATASLPIFLENTTNQPLNLQQNDISLVGTDAAQFQIVSSVFPLSVPTGAVFQLDVRFDPMSAGVKTAEILIETGIASTPPLSTNLRGLGHSGFGGGQEPPLSQILDLYEINSDIGFSGLNPSPGDFQNGLLGEEVEFQLLQKAVEGPVTIEPLATFGPANEPDYRFGWYTPGSLPELNFLFDAETLELASGGDAQTVNVLVEQGGAVEFDPGNQAFGLFGEYYPSLGTVNAFTQDELNTFDAGNRKYRFWPLRDKSNAVVPNAFVVAVEEATNDDFNDAVLIIRNVKTTLPGDYNSDNNVGNSDLAAWISNYGSTSNFNADGNSDGRVNGFDFLIWQRNYVSVAANSEPLEDFQPTVASAAAPTLSEDVREINGFVNLQVVIGALAMRLPTVGPNEPMHRHEVHHDNRAIAFAQFTDTYIEIRDDLTSRNSSDAGLRQNEEIRDILLGEDEELAMPIVMLNDDL